MFYFYFTCQASERCLPNKNPCFCKSTPCPAKANVPWHDLPNRLPADSTLRLVQSWSAGVNGILPKELDGSSGSRGNFELKFRLSGSNGEGNGLF